MMMKMMMKIMMMMIITIRMIMTGTMILIIVNNDHEVDVEGEDDDDDDDYHRVGKAETPLRLHVWRYMTCPTKKKIATLYFLPIKADRAIRAGRVWPARMARGQCIRTCAKTRRSRGNAGRAAMFMRLRVRFSNSLC